MTNINTVVAVCAYKARMTSRIAPFLLTILLALSFLSGGVTGGIAQPGMMIGNGGVTEMVICSDGVAVTVLVDAEGNPVDPQKPCLQHRCTQCFQTGAVALPDHGFDLIARQAILHASRPAPVRLAAVKRLFPIAARGPPFKV